MTSAEDCEHPTLSVQPSAHRLKERLVPGGEAVTSGWMLIVEVACAECGLPFRFEGLPARIESDRPGINHSGSQLFAPVWPAPVAQARKGWPENQGGNQRGWVL